MSSVLRIGIFFLFSLTITACGKHDERTVSEAAVTKYTCPMHPQVIQDKPGSCPICGMDLVKVNSSNSDDGSIMLSESQLRLANITTAAAHFETIGENTVLTGKLVIDEEQTEVISTRVEGRIEKLYFKEAGQSIKRGQELYAIYSESLMTLQQEYLVSLAQSEGLKNTGNESFLKSAEKKLILFGMTKAQIGILAQRRQADPRIVFLAPVSGIIARIDATEGQYVQEGSPLYRIEKLDQVWAEAELYSGESSLIKEGDIVSVKINGFENSAVAGKVVFLSPEYRAGTQITMLRIVVSNPKGEFRPGMQVTVNLPHSDKKAITLPQDAVIRDAIGSHVWMLAEDGAFKPRMVVTGLENSEKIEITAGVEENENVVITGAYLLYGELVLKKGGNPMTTHHH